MANRVAWWEELESQSSVVSQEGEHHLFGQGAHPQRPAARGVETVSSPQLAVLLGIPGLSAQAGAFS